jgi:hypothetical protein
MTGAGRIDPRLVHQPENHVAGPERHGDAPLADETGADQAARIVAGPGDDAGGGETVAALPVRRQGADDRGRRAHRRQLRGQARRGRVDRWRPPVAAREIHEIHAGAVAGVERRVPANQQRRGERADEVHAVGRRIAAGVLLEELADLRPGKSLERARAGVLAEHGGAAHRFGDFGALARRARVHPDRRDRARQHRRHLLRQGTAGVEPAQQRRSRRVQIHAAVLLRRSADGGQFCQIEAGRRDPADHPVERVGPHDRRGDCLVRRAPRQHAMVGPVLRQRLVEGQGGLEDDASGVAVDDDGGQALGAGVESKIVGHGGILWFWAV